MEADVVLDFSDLERLQRAVKKRKQQICQQIADVAARNAASPAYNKGRTPNVDYHAEVEIEGDTVTAHLEAEPLSEGADINLRIALVGRKAYTMRPRFAKVMLWQAGVKGDPIEGVAKVIHKRAIPPIGNFLEAAMKNAVVQVRNRYR